MTSMQKQIDSVVANFPKPKGNIKMNEPSAEPNPLAIIKFTKHLQSCAISIPNSNDDLGYLGAIVSDDIYQKCNANGTSYTAPNDPGRAPVWREFKNREFIFKTRTWCGVRVVDDFVYIITIKEVMFYFNNQPS